MRAGIAISFCVVAVWCFLKKRFVALGVLCLAISLALKPHDTGLVWLYFLLAGGVYRKRALQTLAVFAALSLPVILWVTHVSPHWMQELHSNMSALSVHGGLNDPSPASSGAHGLGMMINLQTALSFFRDDPRFYNPATYLVCGVLLLVWAFTTLRSRVTPAGGLAGAGGHCASFHAACLSSAGRCRSSAAYGSGLRHALGRGRPCRRGSRSLVNAAGLVLTGDLTWAIILGPLSNLHLTLSRQAGQILIAALVFPAPLILLAMAIFYLWVYVRRGHKPAPPEKHEPAEDAPIGTVMA